jgi:hypothetical protein
MEEKDSSGITITLKGGAGYEAPWIVIHASTVAEGGAILEELRTLEALQTVQEAAREFRSAVPTMSQAVQDIQNVFPGSQAYQPGQIPGGQQLPQQYQPGGTVQQCAHGPMKYIATGRYGPFWACPTPQGAPDKCKSRNAN